MTQKYWQIYKNGKMLAQKKYFGNLYLLVQSVLSYFCLKPTKLPVIVASSRRDDSRSWVLDTSQKYSEIHLKIKGKTTTHCFYVPVLPLLTSVHFPHPSLITFCLRNHSQKPLYSWMPSPTSPPSLLPEIISFPRKPYLKARLIYLAPPTESLQRP